jgi:hypothetical protein
MNKTIKHIIVFFGAVSLIMLGALALSGSQDGIKQVNSPLQENNKLTNNNMPLYSEASASLVPLNSEELSNNSYTILIGTVKEINPSKWNSVDGKRPNGIDSFSMEHLIYTDIIISVDKYLKNPLSSKEVTVRVDGGTVGNDTYEAMYEPSFNSNEKVLLYLTKDATNRTKNISPEHYRVTGCMQGKFTLTHNGEAVRPGENFSQNELLSKIKE